MAKILILIGAHLCTAPRPQKEADTLAAAGHEVTVAGVWFDPVLVERDRQLISQKSWRFQPVLDFQPHHRIKRWGARLQGRLAREQFQRLGIVSPALLGYGAKAMLRTAIQHRADLTIVHSEAGLWVGEQLLKRGFRVGVDFEDWFSQDLLPSALQHRPVKEIKRLEAHLIQHCSYCLTTSNVMAETLSQVYQAAKPTVIYNSFPQIGCEDGAAKNQQAPPSLHWFSQTIGPGRGLELLCEALPHLPAPLPIHLRGNCTDSTRQWLYSLIPEVWQPWVSIHPTVPNDQLHACIAEHDIGLALERADLTSTNLTVSNKMFQYMQAGLAVIATDTAGQQEVYQQAPGMGHLVPWQDPIALAAAIRALTQNPGALESAQRTAVQAFQNQFCWERQSDRLLEAVNRALND
jgi:glycosyltransferase involved in cell wall biosynthesis